MFEKLFSKKKTKNNTSFLRSHKHSENLRRSNNQYIQKRRLHITHTLAILEKQILQIYLKEGFKVVSRNEIENDHKVRILSTRILLYYMPKSSFTILFNTGSLQSFT